uniref:Uncharacterized protein n=1 Tax=Sphingobacterium sp. (strain 21) TaxID=743722 RepID=F4C441_SPHS2
MTLGFSQQINGKPNYFAEKIWLSILEGNFPDEIKFQYDLFYKEYANKFGKHWDAIDFYLIKGKAHTIRHDPQDRWKAGKIIHPVINNRTTNRFQFAPAILCISTQKIKIVWGLEGQRFAKVYIDDHYIGIYNEKSGTFFEMYDKIGSLSALAQNDGFDSVKDFFAYFNQDFEGKIIHWNDLKY